MRRRREAALASGASQEEAAAAGEAAWSRMYAEQQAMRIEEMAREAAFSAALKAIQDGRADEAIAAAQYAYNETAAAALAAFAVIEQALDALPTHKNIDINIRTNRSGRWGRWGWWWRWRRWRRVQRHKHGCCRPAWRLRRPPRRRMLASRAGRWKKSNVHVERQDAQPL